MIELSIVIVNWNTRDLLVGCLKSISDERCSLRSSSTEVFVVDNASNDSSVSTLREEFPWVQLIVNSSNVGFACANNQAVRVASGKYILLLNSDTVIHPGALTRLIEFMNNTTDAGACGAQLLNSDGSLQHSCLPMMTPEREFWRLSYAEHLWRVATYAMDQWRTDREHPVDAIAGACLMIRRAAMEQVGLLDENYFMYTEEVDYCLRLSRAGWGVWYVPAAVVTHYGGASSRLAEEAMYVQLYRSKIQFFRKFGGTSQARLAKVLWFLAFGPRALFAAPVSLFRHDFRNRARIYRSVLVALPTM